MKKICLLFIVAFHFTGIAQCDYSSIFKNNATKSLFLKLNPITVDIYETPFNGRLILATLIRNGDIYYIDFEITRDSSAQDLEPHCFENNDSVVMSLADNTKVTLKHIQERICGIKVENNDQFTSVTDYLRVIITPEDLKKLTEKEVILMEFKSSDFNKTVVLKSELEEFYDDEIYTSNPTRFFIDHIECLKNPRLE